VIPNEKPNRIGLRHDSGPSHPPPSTRNTTLWTRPLANSSTPAAYRKLWYPVRSYQYRRSDAPIAAAKLLAWLE
jgi:hypothetical protein